MNLRFFYRCLKTQYRDQKFECRALNKFLLSHDTVLDIGCNKGSYLWTLSRAVPKGKVIGFEPQPLLFKYLRSQTKSMFLSNVQIEELAISSTSSTARIFLPKSEQTSPSASLEENLNETEANSYIVETVSIDQYCENNSYLENIRAMKIDVEGHELSVLKGAREIIKNNRPLIVCESESRHLPNGDVAEFLDLMYSLDYHGFFVHPISGLMKLSIFDSKIHQAQTGERFWDSKNYCNNFIFYHKDTYFSV